MFHNVNYEIVIYIKLTIRIYRIIRMPDTISKPNKIDFLIPCYWFVEIIPIGLHFYQKLNYQKSVKHITYIKWTFISHYFDSEIIRIAQNISDYTISKESAH